MELLQAQYRRLAGRRGKKRVLVAVAHSLLVVIYHLLKKQDLHDHDLRGDYFDKLDPSRLSRHFVRRLQSLGYDVTLTPRNKQFHKTPSPHDSFRSSSATTAPSYARRGGWFSEQSR